MQCIQVNPPTQNVCKSICCSFPIKFSIKECVGSSISFELLVHREKKVGVEAKPRIPMHISICVSICMPVHLSLYLYSFIHIFLSKREALYYKQLDLRSIRAGGKLQPSLRRRSIRGFSCKVTISRVPSLGYPPGN